jgi:hypothetical protein
MKIHASLEQMTVEAIHELFERQIMEGPRLDYKQSLIPLNDSTKFELLKDVTAFANSRGGHLVYGVAQNENGIPSQLMPFDIPFVDKLHNEIDNIFNDLIEERIQGLRHRAIPASDGGFYYVIHVPESPQAPHMIKMSISKPRFYQRVNTVNAPMTIRQIKDTVLRIERAVDVAEDFVTHRIKDLAEEHHLFAAVHAIPLYTEAYSLDLTDKTIYERFARLSAGEGRHCALGYLIGQYNRGIHEQVIVTRSGGVEWFKTSIALKHKDGIPILSGAALEARVCDFMYTVRDIGIDGLLDLPALINLCVLSKSGMQMWADGDILDVHHIEELFCPDSAILYDWADLDLTLKRFFDVLWQTFGIPSSPNFTPNGQRIYR